MEALTHATLPARTPAGSHRVGAVKDTVTASPGRELVVDRERDAATRETKVLHLGRPLPTRLDVGDEDAGFVTGLRGVSPEGARARCDAMGRPLPRTRRLLPRAGPPREGAREHIGFSFGGDGVTIGNGLMQHPRPRACCRARFDGRRRAMSQDTRRDPRAKIVSLNVRYKSATVDEFIDNHSHDVSKGGLFIKTASPFPSGTLLKFEIRIAGDRAVIAGVGRVVWKREAAQAGPEQPAGMGVKFIKIDDASRAVIDLPDVIESGCGSRLRVRARSACRATANSYHASSAWGAGRTHSCDAVRASTADVDGPRDGSRPRAAQGDDHRNLPSVVPPVPGAPCRRAPACAAASSGASNAPLAPAGQAVTIVPSAAPRPSAAPSE